MITALLLLLSLLQLLDSVCFEHCVSLLAIHHLRGKDLRLDLSPVIHIWHWLFRNESCGGFYLGDGVDGLDLGLVWVELHWLSSSTAHRGVRTHHLSNETVLLVFSLLLSVAGHVEGVRVQENLLLV